MLEKKLAPKFCNLNTSASNELLVRVSEIRKKHELIAEITGERFNIFSILGLQSAENRTHSAFLRELLDPQGSHGMRDKFLKAFFRMLCSKHDDCEHFRLERLNESLDLAAEVKTEMHIGYKSADGSQGGRIDIAIIPKSIIRRIHIENKIYAIDQDCQLLRYYNYDPEAVLLYLTLEGKEASSESTQLTGSGNKPEEKNLIAGIHYFPISYKTHILEWLEECRKEASVRPLARETIAQYINLIRNLTQQSISHQMDNDIKSAILNTNENFKSSKNIAETYLKIINERKYFLKSKIGNLPDVHVIKYNQLDIYFNYCIDESVPYMSFHAADKDGNKQNTNSNLEELRLILNKFGFKSNEWHVGWKYCSFWSDEQALYDLCKSSPEEAIQNVIKEGDNYINSFKFEISNILQSSLNQVTQ